MAISTAFVRILFVILSVIFMVTFAMGIESKTPLWTYSLGTLLGLALACALIGMDRLFKRFNLRAFNLTVIGLFFGYLMSLALIAIFNAILDISGVYQEHSFVGVVKIFLFLFGTYLGTVMTLRSADEIYLSIPFVKFSPTTQQVKDILLDLSALSDPRIIDLVASGLLDKRLLLPRFLIKELHKQEESSDEIIASRAKRALEVVKKLETLPGLQLRYHDTDFSDVKDITSKVLALSRLTGADVLSADINRVQMAQIEGVRIINIHALSNALKPLMQRGEFLKIKIQRYGKEEMQGVGYLEDGTMVVVNGGGAYIGDTIAAHVLSVKHTSSGRMVFCNVANGETGDDDEEDNY